MPGWVAFDALKRTVSLEAVLRHYRVPGLRRHRDQLQGRCPIHRGTRQDSFRVSLTKNVFHCFGCQAGGDVLAFVAAMEKCAIRQAALHLQRWFTTEPWLANPVLRIKRKEELVRKEERCNPPLRFALTGVDHGHGYLAGRGVDRATAAAFGVGFYGRPGLMSGRIVIPIHNARGEIVAYAGRALEGGLPKYKLPVGFRKDYELFNLHRASATGSRAVIVVEGYFDCLRVYQAQMPWVVALMGSSLSAQQEQAMLAGFERVILLLDGDAVGRAASQAIAARLARRCSLDVVQVPDGAQPDQLSSPVLQQLLNHR
jgi:DNA primase